LHEHSNRWYWNQANSEWGKQPIEAKDLPANNKPVVNNEVHVGETLHNNEGNLKDFLRNNNKEIHTESISSLIPTSVSYNLALHYLTPILFPLMNFNAQAMQGEHQSETMTLDILSMHMKNPP